MLSCKQASQLISQSLDRRLTWGERFALRFHLMICDVCKRFKLQLDLMVRAVRTLRQQTEVDERIKLTAEARQRISRQLVQVDPEA